MLRFYLLVIFGDCTLANGHGQVSFFENKIQSVFTKFKNQLYYKAFIFNNFVSSFLPKNNLLNFLRKFAPYIEDERAVALSEFFVWKSNFKSLGTPLWSGYFHEWSYFTHKMSSPIWPTSLSSKNRFQDRIKNSEKIARLRILKIRAFWSQKFSLI